MKDAMGNELTEGDSVYYVAGRSIQEGIFLKGHDSGRVTVRPVRALSGPLSRTLHLDTRTGKFADRYSHRTVESHWVHKETRAKLDWNKHMSKRIYESNSPGWGYTTKDNPDYVPEELREHVDDVFADYLMEINIPGGYATVLYNNRRLVKI